MNPKISFVMANYNGEDTIEKCVDSILVSRRIPVEVIVIDDGSLDNSIKIIEKICERDSRVHLIKQKNNGVSSARNLGIKVAKGDYLYFIDSDDFLVESWPVFVEPILEEDSYDLIFFDYAIISGDIASQIHGNLFDCEKPSKENVVSLFITTDSNNAAWAKLFKRVGSESYNQVLFRDDMKLGEDGFYVGQKIAKAKNFRYSANTIQFYRKYAGNFSNKLNHRLDDRIELYKLKQFLGDEFVSDRGVRAAGYSTSVRNVFYILRNFAAEYGRNDFIRIVNGLTMNAQFWNLSSLKSLPFFLRSQYWLLVHSKQSFYVICVFEEFLSKLCRGIKR